MTKSATQATVHAGVGALGDDQQQHAFEFLHQLTRLTLPGIALGAAHEEKKNARPKRQEPCDALRAVFAGERTGIGEQTTAN